MKKTLLYLFLMATVLGCNSETDTDKMSQTADSEMTEKLRHVVLFSFSESSSPEDIQEIEEAFAALPSQIEEIKDFEWGLNNSPEGLAKGFTHCFLVTFDSEEGRDIYLPHPAHQEFVSLLDPHLEDVLVIDYWAK